MATKKSPARTKHPSSGSDPKSKRIVASKMEATMGEFKRHELESGRTGRKVTNPKQALAIALSESRKQGAKIPPSPNQAGAEKTSTKKTKKS